MSDAASRLNKVLRVKGLLEKKTQRELVAIRERHEREEAALEHLREENRSALTETVRMLKARATDLQTSRAFLKALSRRIEKQQQRLSQIETEEQKKQEELVLRSQDRRMIETLQEKREAEESEEKKRKEQRLIDVLANRVRFGM